MSSLIFFKEERVMILRYLEKKYVFALILGSVSVSGCNSVSAGVVSPTENQDSTNRSPAQSSNEGSGKVVGDSCKNDDPKKICLAIKYVVYQNSSGTPVVSEAEAIKNVRSMNQLYLQCGMS